MIYNTYSEHKKQHPHAQAYTLHPAIQAQYISIEEYIYC